MSIDPVRLGYTLNGCQFKAHDLKVIEFRSIACQQQANAVYQAYAEWGCPLKELGKILGVHYTAHGSAGRGGNMSLQDLLPKR